MPPNVTFYILKSASGQKRWIESCRILESVYASGKTIFVHTDSLRVAEKLDQALWIFQDTSFIPHAIYQDETSLCPVTIGTGEAPKQFSFKALANFAKDIPPYYARFAEMIEFVPAQISEQQAARERFKQYRLAGCNLSTINA